MVRNLVAAAALSVRPSGRGAYSFIHRKHTFFTTVTSRDSSETKHVHRIRKHLPQSTLTATTGHEHCISLDADETHSFSSHGWIFARRVDPIRNNYYDVQANCHFLFSMQSIVLVVPDATERKVHHEAARKLNPGSNSMLPRVSSDPRWSDGDRGNPPRTTVPAYEWPSGAVSFTVAPSLSSLSGTGVMFSTSGHA